MAPEIEKWKVKTGVIALGLLESPAINLDAVPRGWGFPALKSVR
jgi:hypothetical protein